MMKTAVGVFSMLAATAGIEVSAQSIPQPVVYQNGIAKGVVRVKFAEDMSPQLQSFQNNRSGISTLGISAFDVTAKRFEASNMRRVFPYNPKTEHKLIKHGLHLWYEMEVNSESDLRAVTHAFSSIAEVEFAEPMLEKKLIDGKYTQRSISFEEATAMATSASTSDFDDPMLGKQWHYNNTKQRPEFTEGADINLFEAWKTTTGNSNVIVSVHDEGIDTNHEDLRANLWINTGEIPGNGIDDDGNGYVDDIYGYSFSNRSGDIPAQTHGTHVGGTVAAVSNNGVGVAGVAGGDGSGNGARLMSLQILGGQYSNVASSYIYAADNGAVISQNSWGYTTPGSYEQVVLDGIDYFIEEAGDYEGSPMRGGIVIFASGNDDYDGEMYPGYYEKTLTVASTGPSWKKAWYSNYGDWIHISAPGGDNYVGGDEGSILSTLPGNNYGYLDGTSMACPHVAGVAALTVSHLGGASYTADILWNQLVNSTNDIYQYNESYEGKLGYGQIDAAKSLVKNEGIGPVAITDLASNIASDVFIELTWSTPSDEDDGYPASYVIYYSEEEITAENYMSAKTETMRAVDTSELNKKEIDGLEGNKMYYFVIKSFDRWGNESELSNIISASTNNGPTVAIPVASVDFMLDPTKLMDTQTFMLNNEGEGVLRWSTFVNQGSFYYDWKSYATTFPKVGAPSHRKSNVKLFQAPQVKKFSMDEEVLEEFVASKLTYSNWFHPMYNVGEEDITLSNTSAVAFHIADEEGFNLTDTELFLNEMVNGPIEVEIYQGAILSEAKKVTSATIDYGYDFQKTHYVKFDEQVFFPQGSIVWLLVKTKAGNTYPLSISHAEPGAENAADVSQWLSFDEGKTWQTLVNALDAEGYAFAQALISKNATLGEVVKLSPMEGEILPGESMEVTVDVDAMKLINGTYKFITNVESNDKAADQYKLPININVTDRLPELKSMPIVEFGSVILGFDKEVSVNLSNFGYGKFGVSSVTSSDPQFTLEGNLWEVNARSNAELILKFTPTQTGNVNGEITVTSSTGITHTFSVFAVVGEPAEIEVTPLEQTYSIVKGDDNSGEVTIVNNGAYPLTYVFPQYSDNLPDDVHRFGYSWTLFEDMDGSNYVSIANEEGAVNVAPAFVDDPNLKWQKFKMNFDFPFYGEYQNEWFVSKNGIVAKDDTDNFNSSPGLGYEYLANGYISAMYYIAMDLGIGGEIWIQNYDERTVVEYKNVQGPWWNGPASFQIVLYASGNFDILYDDVTQVGYDLEHIFIAAESPDKTDGVLVYENNWNNPVPFIFERQQENVRVRFNYPGSKIINNLSSLEGTVAVGSSKTINFDIDSKTLVHGNNVQNIAIFSNDPNMPLSHFKVIVDVNGGTAADIELSTMDINYGGQLLGGQYLHMLNMSNKGDKATSITSASLADGTYFSVDFTGDFALNPRSGKQMKVYFNPTVAGDFTDVLTLMDSDGKEYVINISAEGLNPPAIDLDVTPHTYNLKVGESTEFEVTVSNKDGLVDLDILPRMASWLSLVEDEAMVSNVPDFDYTWRTNQNELKGAVDPEAPKFEWIDIISEENRINHFESEDDFWWQPYELPWPVEFYGKEYNEMWIAYAAVVAFEKPGNLYDGIFNTDLPMEDGINGVASSLWMLGASNPTDESPIKGIYAYHDDEKVVVTHSRYQHNFAFFGGFVTCQTIFYRDGVVKMQYKVENQNGVDGWSNKTTIGLENATGTSASKVAFGSAIVKDRFVIEYVPSHKMTIAAGEEKTLKFKVDASQLIDGQYNTNLTFQNITPDKEQIAIPVQLNVEGTIMLGADDVEFGEVVAGANIQYTEYFNLKNSGSKEVMINSFKLNDGTQSIVEVKEVVDGFWGPQIFWTNINDLWNFPMTVHPGEGIELRATMTPVTPDVITDVLTSVDTEGMEWNVNLVANAYEPSAFSWDAMDKEFVSLDPKYTDQFAVVVSNEGGKSILDYQLEIDFNRDGAPMAVNNNGDIQSFSTTTSTLSSLRNKSTSNDDDYHAVLKYVDTTIPTTAVGYGGDEMSVGTAFVAPKDGFNLSHVETYYRPYGKDNADIRVNILVGSDINTATEVYENVFTTETLGTDEEGDFIVFDLGEEITFFPGERFFVVFTYSQGVEYAQGIVVEESRIGNTFYIWTTDGILDITTDANWEGLRWMNKAMAKNPITGSWLEIDSEGGALEVDATATFNVSLDASFAKKVDNYAAVKAYTNDPFNPELEFLVTLKKNASPSFGDDIVSSLDMDVLTEKTISFMAEDREGHTFTYGLESPTNSVTATEVDGKYEINIAPQYADGDMFKFSVTATDELEEKTMHEVTVNVNLINRAPEFIGDEVVNIKVGESTQMSPEELFIDHDGDELTFEIATSDHGIAVATMAGKYFFMAGISTGSTEVAFMATDKDGLSTIQTVEVNVGGQDSPTSIDQDVLVSEVKNFPNPVLTETTISFNLKEQGNVSVAVYNINGGMVERLNVGTMASGVQKVEYNASKLNTGMYIYAIMVDNQFVGYGKMIKK
ncbi:S8 family serine peptidase [Flammeovirga pacifica]|uniref:Fibronectin type-III domain-containing protein n=1 Tax=Flammeovirga pacifica TaxID=915059 RepID=A0A1S1YZF6_FLAPC|nr:S8 family serine peptidase [Flammeovirga pacifica]OHX66401.1 hypothetical protein NH26_08555 [Flammeovirga pacifica]